MSAWGWWGGHAQNKMSAWGWWGGHAPKQNHLSASAQEANK